MLRHTRKSDRRASLLISRMLVDSIIQLDQKSKGKRQKAKKRELDDGPSCREKKRGVCERHPALRILSCLVYLDLK
jgi:hypothetical protein